MPIAFAALPAPERAANGTFLMPPATDMLMIPSLHTPKPGKCRLFGGKNKPIGRGTYIHNVLKGVIESRVSVVACIQ